MAETRQRAGTGASKAVARRTANKPAKVVTPPPNGDAPAADYDLAAIVDQRRDALGHDGDMVTFHQGGMVFEMPHPLFATDEWKEGLAEVRGDVDFAKYVLGDQYDEFRERGGQSSHIAILVDQIQRDARDADGAGRPTASSTFSREQRRRQRPR
jgi:hypothetical protein